MKSLARTSLALAAFLVPALTFAATTVVGGISSNGGGFLGFSWGSGAGSCLGSICSVANTILFIINGVLVPLLFAIAFIVFLWGVFKAYIWSAGDAGEVQQGHQLILWGIIGFAVMVSLWGLVNVVASTFGLAGYSAPPLPTSY